MAKKPTLNSATTAPPSDFPHVLTTEDRRKGAARTNEIRRERAQSEREKLAEVYEAHRKELMDVVIAEVKKGNMQAFFGLHDRIYGTPAKAEPERTEIELVSGEARGTSLMDMLGELSQSPDNAGSNGDSGQ
jgi:hypothetical protein